jgi:hypothetical protein
MSSQPQLRIAISASMKQIRVGYRLEGKSVPFIFEVVFEIGVVPSPVPQALSQDVGQDNSQNHAHMF